MFARGGQQFAASLECFYARAADDDLYFSYAIVHPTIDRSRPAHQQPEPLLYAGVLAERDGGIVIRAAQMLGTGSVMSDSIYVSVILPLKPGEEDYALSFVVPNNTPGSEDLSAPPLHGWPDLAMLYADQTIQATLYPEVVQMARAMMGGSLIQLPSSVADLVSPESAPDFQRYVRWADAPAAERIKLLNLLWDLVGSEFGSRHLQYEMFYSCQPAVNKAREFRSDDWAAAESLIDRCLSSYELRTPPVAVPLSDD